jgi:hypothetical protein
MVEVESQYSHFQTYSTYLQLISINLWCGADTLTYLRHIFWRLSSHVYCMFTEIVLISDSDWLSWTTTNQSYWKLLKAIVETVDSVDLSISSAFSPHFLKPNPFHLRFQQSSSAQQILVIRLIRDPKNDFRDVNANTIYKYTCVSIDVRIYICMYVCMYMFMFMYMYIYIYIYICEYRSINMYFCGKYTNGIIGIVIGR